MSEARKCKVCTQWLGGNRYSSQLSIEVASICAIPAALEELPLGNRREGDLVLVIWPDLERGDGTAVSIYPFRVSVQRKFVPMLGGAGR